jgi:hypothetical protein
MQFQSQISIALLCLLLRPALAVEPNSANFMMPACRSARPDVSQGMQGICLGMVTAIATIAPGVCRPLGATNDEAMRVVVQYIDSRPGRLHEPFIELAAEALKQAWPCTANGPPPPRQSK